MPEGVVQSKNNIYNEIRAFARSFVKTYLTLASSRIRNDKMSEPSVFSRERMNAYNLLDPVGSFGTSVTSDRAPTITTSADATAPTLIGNIDRGGQPIASSPTVATAIATNSNERTTNTTTITVAASPMSAGTAAAAASAAASAVVSATAASAGGTVGDGGVASTVDAPLGSSDPAMMGDAISRAPQPTEGVTVKTQTRAVQTETHEVTLVENPAQLTDQASSTVNNDQPLSEPVRQAYIFLSERNRQDLRKIARRWNCPQGFTKKVLVARLVMYVYEQVEKLKKCNVRDVLGAVETWGFETFLAQWEAIHRKKDVLSWSMLEKLANSHSKIEVDAMLSELPRMCGKRKLRKTRLRERGGPMISDGEITEVDPPPPLPPKRKVGRPPKYPPKGALIAALAERSMDAAPAPPPPPSTGTSQLPSYGNALNRPVGELNRPFGELNRPVDESIKPVGEPNLPVLPLPGATTRETHLSSLEPVLDKLGEVSERLKQLAEVVDKGGERRAPSTKTDIDKSEEELEAERKLLVQLGVAKQDLENARNNGDEEIERRWGLYVDKIRKKLNEFSREGTDG